VNSADPEQSVRFVALLTGLQSRLYAYLCTLLANAGDARDVLQETNIALWQKAPDFDFSRSFEPWAMRFAHFQALAWRKRQSRDRLVFDDATLDLLALEFDGGHGAEGELRALDECLGKLPEKQRALVARRYQEAESVNAIAASEGKPPNVVAAFLYRARKALADCIRAALGTEEKHA
jgi:RNA polymerase sigma-70 factor, ECF subfamily